MAEGETLQTTNLLNVNQDIIIFMHILFKVPLSN